VSNTLQVYIKGLQENKLSTVSILNADGVVLKTIYTSSINQSLQLNVASLATGIFTIKIISGDKIMYKQFVKM
jgi:hypothetical protein